MRSKSYASESVISRSLRYWLVEKICSRIGNASRSRSNSVASDSGLRAAPTKRSKLFSAMSGSLSRGKCSAKLIAHVAQQIERHARKGHPHQAGVRPIDVVQPPRGKPAPGFLGMIEIVAKLCVVHGERFHCPSIFLAIPPGDSITQIIRFRAACKFLQLQMGTCRPLPSRMLF